MEAKTKKKVLFIINPHAGKGQIRASLIDIIDILVKADFEVTVYTTQKRGDAVEKTKDCGGKYDLVVCSGGDGTLDEIVTGMILSGHSTDIGYIPAGSTNDFANSLKIPSNMKEAAEIIARGNRFPCDVGMFNDDVFVYIAAFGILTEVSYGTPQGMKNMLGHMAYVLEGMKHLQNIQSYHMKVTCTKYLPEKMEGEDIVIEDDFIFGMITNSYSVGGFRSITNNITRRTVTLNDGLFEVTLIRHPKNPMELNSILAALISENIDSEYMYCFKAKELLIESGESVSWTLDGEYGGEHIRVCLENKCRAVNIMTDEEYGKNI